MIETTTTISDYLDGINRLTAQEQLQLAQRILANLSQQIDSSPKEPLQSLLGIWQGFTITDEDITEARQEMWANFGDRDYCCDSFVL